MTNDLVGDYSTPRDEFSSQPESIYMRVGNSAVITERNSMSFQAYLDTVEDKTGLSPRQFIQLAEEKGFDDASVKAGTILEWLKEDYGLGRGHGMAIVHVIKKARPFPRNIWEQWEVTGTSPTRSGSTGKQPIRIAKDSAGET